MEENVRSSLLRAKLDRMIEASQDEQVVNTQRPAWLVKLDKWWQRWHYLIGWTLLLAQFLALVAYQLGRL